jgi:hydrogenase maturation protease
MSDPVVVLGLGNVLLADDGAGVAALHLLAREYDPPPGVRFLDGGTLGLALLDLLEPDSTLILVDAVRTDAAPGTVVVFEGEDVEDAAAARLSVHQIGVADLLAAARLLGRTPKRVVLAGVVPASMELSIERTPAVAAALPELVSVVVAELARAGYPPTPRAAGAPRPNPGDGGDALGL